MVNYMIRKCIAKVAISLKSKESLKYANEMKKLFYSNREEVEKYQKQKLSDLLLYAYGHTAYYSRIFDEIGLVKDGVLHWENYDKIPILTKDIIRKEGNNLVSDECEQRHAYFNTSGGSTGEPVTFVQDKYYFRYNFGDKILFGLLNDKEPGERELKLWGSERDIKEGSIGIKEKLINFAYNRKLLNSFMLTEDKMESYTECINKEKPRQIWTYADSIYQLSKYILEKNMKMYSPHNIIATAGVLYEEMRAVIQQAFPKSRILNQYGSREAGAIGLEVNGERGIRVFEHAIFMEMYNQNENTISQYGDGEILITNLTNYSMPLIRFNIGDTGTHVRCDDAHVGEYSILSALHGRVNSHIKLKDGTIIHGEYFTHIFYGKNWVENFQVVQHSYDEVEIFIVVRKGKEACDKDLEEMKKDIYLVMGECNITVTYCKSIPKLKSGKYQFVISEV